MIVVGFDSETTGLQYSNGARIIEVSLIGYDLGSEKKLFDYTRLTNPHRPIEPRAQLLHGITQSALIGKPSFKELEPFITKILTKADLLVCHNLAFDVPFLYSEYGLIGKDVPNVEGFCTMESGRAFTSLGKKPNLGELCWACGVDYDPSKAHGAAYDTEVMMECFFYGLRHGGFTLPEKVK